MSSLQPIREEEMLERLRQALRQNQESSFLWQLSQKVHDPGSSPSLGKSQRLHPLLVIFSILAMIAAGTLAYFTCAQP